MRPPFLAALAQRFRARLAGELPSADRHFAAAVAQFRALRFPSTRRSSPSSTPSGSRGRPDRRGRTAARSGCARRSSGSTRRCGSSGLPRRPRPFRPARDAKPRGRIDGRVGSGRTSESVRLSQNTAMGHLARERWRKVPHWCLTPTVSDTSSRPAALLLWRPSVKNSGAGDDLRDDSGCAISQ